MNTDTVFELYMISPLSPSSPMTQRKENVIMFPLMKQGHIVPFPALALHLESINKYTITFVSTHLKWRNSNNLSLNAPPFTFFEIPFNSIDHDLPPCTEDTDSLPFHVVGKLLEATLSFKPHFRKLIVDLIDEQMATNRFVSSQICSLVGASTRVRYFSCYIYSRWWLWLRMLWVNLPIGTQIPMNFCCWIFPKLQQFKPAGVLSESCWWNWLYSHGWL